MSAPITFTLPYPPSANRLWRRYGNRMVKSDEAWAYQAAAQWTAMQAMPAIMEGEVILTLTYFRPRKVGDLDNRLKGLLDSLQGAVYHDDKQVCELHMYRREDKHNPRVEVEVREVTR